MSSPQNTARPFELLGLLAGAARQEIERRAEALASLLKLGLTPPEGDAVALAEGYERTPLEVAEAARLLRDPQRWLREVVLWPDGFAVESALAGAADLLEGAAGRPAEPATLVRQLAHQYLTDEVGRHKPTEQPEQWMQKKLTAPARPSLYFGPRPAPGTDPRKGS